MICPNCGNEEQWCGEYDEDMPVMACPVCEFWRWGDDEEEELPDDIFIADMSSAGEDYDDWEQE